VVSACRYALPAIRDRAANLDSIDQVTGLEARYAPIRPALAAEPEAGFVTNVSARRGEDIPEYYLAQYVFIPTVLERGAGHRIVVGDFYSQLPPVDPETLDGLEPVATAENGVVLYRRRER
jgi:hypothetical protein